MYKVAIVGCENSHAIGFLDCIIKDKRGPEIEVVGVYSDETEEALKLQEKYGVPVADSYDAFVGKIDALIITARHGANHYKYAKPYLNDNIPMFIDKPITVSEEEAIEFMGELKKREIAVCGGSVCIYDSHVQKLKGIVETKEHGQVFGGYLRAPVFMENKYGDFYFYAQHLVHIMCEIFGYNPKSVQAFRCDRTYTCIFRYENYDVTALYEEGTHQYYANVNSEELVVGDMFALENCMEREFDAFVNVLEGGEQEWSYEDFFAPVFIINAAYRSIQSGKEEKIAYPDAQ